MSPKNSDSLLVRFPTRNRRSKAIECLLNQKLVLQNKKLAEEIYSAGKFLVFQNGESITVQDSTENDIYFLLSGEVCILVKGKEVSRRHRDNHFGEMALLDTAAKRSATVKSVGETIVIKVPEVQFSKIAKKFPVLWQRLSAELAERLRERSKFIRQSNFEPVVFIGSSSESKVLAKSLEGGFKRRGIKTKSWINSVFTASSTSIEGLLHAADSSDFGVLILSPDDLVVSRRKKSMAPRDNVIFELGLFMGGLGRERVYILVEKLSDIKVPTDLLGVTLLQYGSATPYGRRPDLIKCIEQIHHHVKKLSVR